jgi:hypothetical protein
VLTLVTAFQLAGLWLTLRVYWLPADGFRPRRVAAAGHNILAWSPWPPVVELPPLVGTAVVGVGTLLAAYRPGPPVPAR